MQIDVLKGIGQKTAEYLHEIGIYTVEDLLFYLPYRYQDRTRLVPIAYLRNDDEVVVEGKVISANIVFGKRRQLQVTIEDNTGRLILKFFYFNKAQQAQFTEGMLLRCFGTAKWWQGKFSMIHPEYRPAEVTAPVDEHLTPIYPSIEGFQQHRWRSLADQALHYLQKHQENLEILPQPLREQWQLPDLAQALAYVHKPPPEADQGLLMEGLHPFQQRLAFEELLAHQVNLRQFRQQQQAHTAFPFKKTENFKESYAKFFEKIPYELTQAQQTCLADIQQDLEKSTPMMRLLQGDVGSGKTIVAALAALQAVIAGYQVALMAPTELLAEQHYKQFSTWFAALNIPVAWLTSKLSAPIRRGMEASIRDGEARIVVGTHALFQKSVEFHQLGLIIVDEQHRFGVQQRLSLREKGTHDSSYPHQLIMTATPIPRTLAMTVYADLDVSVIDQLPPGRTPINTVVVNNQRRAEVIEKIEKQVRASGQVYWVCPLIEESDVLESEAAEKTFEQLQAKLPGVVIGLIHGKLKTEQKQAVMQAFKQGEIAILVATTVIEVGIDVPNASVIVIENAERMGLAQLHQLRGRVGRGAKESHCILLYQDPLSEYGRERLKVMRESTDGFYIAQRDLELRGPGELLGTRQTGLQRLRIANIMRDRKLLPKVQTAAQVILEHYPECIDKLMHRWVGVKEEFGKV